MTIQVSISFGEFLDKLTILEIKAERIADPAKRANVVHERDLLRRTWAEHPAAATDIEDALRRLRAINEKLWDIEDAIREQERAGDFGPRFVELARAVYYTNDERAAVKRELNEKLGSELIEEKSYADYQGSDSA